MVRLACIVALLQLSSPQPVPATGSIEGSVVRAGTREPLEDIRVDLVPAELASVPEPFRSPTPVVRTDAQGRFVFKDLAPGNYRLTFSANGFVRHEHGQRSVVSNGVPIRLAAGQAMKNIVEELTPTGSVTGRISDDDRQPLAGVPVQLMRVNYDDSGKRQLQLSGIPVKSDDRGEYRIYFVMPGRYYVNAGGFQTGIYLQSAPNEIPETYASVFFPGVADPQTATPIDVLPGATRIGTDFKVSKVASVRVRGRVIDATTGQPPEKASVSLEFSRYPGGPVDSLESVGRGKVTYNKDGTFEFPDVPPGRFRLSASVDVPGQSRLPTGLAVMRMGFLTLEVGSSDVEGLLVVLSAGGSVSGRVRVEGRSDFASAAKGLVLRHSLGDGQPLSRGWLEPWAEINPDGRFRIENVAPGEFRLYMGELPGIYLKEARLGGTDILTQPFQFTGRETGSLEILLSPGVASLEGIVTDNRLALAPGARVVLAPKRSSHRTELFKTAVTDQEGRFSLTNVVPGDYTLYAWEAIEFYRWFDADFVKADEPFGQAIQVLESSRQTVSVKLIPARNPY